MYSIFIAGITQHLAVEMQHG